MKPKIRVKGCLDDWDNIPLGKLFRESNDRSSDGELLSVSLRYGVVKASLNGRFDNSSEDKSHYKVVNIGDIAYNTMRMWQGACGVSNFNGIVSPAYTVITPLSNLVQTFFIRLFKNKRTLKSFRVNSQGLTSDTWNLKYPLFREINVYYPISQSEQKLISTFFDVLDNKMEIVASRLASLKQVKEASLQAMFPQKGETVPKIRFKGFEGEWEEVLLGSLFSERVENDVTAEMLSVTMRDGIIKANENGRYDNSNSDRSNYKLVLKDDIAYNTMRMWQGASGCSPYRGIVSPAYTVIKPNIGVCSAFFAFYFKTYELINKFRLNSQGLTKDTWNLKYPAFSSISILYPTNVLEQQQIASYFTSLDKQIALQTQRLEKLRQIKAACLDKMFV
jgi:type I restriction enzyme, specificity subunit